MCFCSLNWETWLWLASIVTTLYSIQAVLNWADVTLSWNQLESDYLEPKPAQVGTRWPVGAPPC